MLPLSLRGDGEVDHPAGQTCPDIVRHRIQGQGLCKEEDGGGGNLGEGAQVQGVHGEGD